MRELRIKVPTPDDFVSGEVGKHLLRAYKEILHVFASIPERQIRKIEEFEKELEERRKRRSEP